MTATARRGPPPPGMRRAPVQARSTRRVRLLLDTTAALVDEGGLYAVTTKRVADRSGMSIGSVYRFFPDRLALLRALAARNRDLCMRRIDRLLEAAPPPAWPDAVDAAVDELAAMHRHEPGFRALRFGDVIDGSLTDSRGGDGPFVLGIRDVLVRRVGVPDAPRLASQVRTAVAMCDGIMAAAFAVDRSGDAWMIGRCKTLLRGYVRDCMADTGDREA